MKKLLLTALAVGVFGITPVYAENETFNLNIVKPLVGKHYKKRNHPNGLSYNENYLKSIGFELVSSKGLGVSAIYVDKNSLGNQSIFLHAGYVIKINDVWNIGLWGGGKKWLSQES